MHSELSVQPTSAPIQTRVLVAEAALRQTRVSFKGAISTGLKELGTTRQTIARTSEPPADHDDGLLGQAMPMFGAAYAVMFLAAAVTFWSSGAALFAVVISAGYTLMYFAVPIIMTNLKHVHDTRWTSDVRQVDAAIVDTYTGPIKRWEALLQMVLIPFAVATTFVVFCVIWTIQTA